MMADPDPLVVDSGDAECLRLLGPWTTRRLVEIESHIARVDPARIRIVRLDASEIEAMDTGGAWLLCSLMNRFESQEIAVRIDGLRDEFSRLLDLVKARYQESPSPVAEPKDSLLAGLGRVTVRHAQEAIAMLTFAGEVACAIWRAMRSPARIRWRPLFSNVESAGVNALPIISLLSFLIGVVVAYQAGIQLQNYGANIFIVELVTLSILRELGPLMTAIIVAGRTGSAYTAEIGTMKVTCEVDALQTIGIPPLDLLVLPKILGLMLVLPLLTMVADAAGIFGGMVIASSLLDVGFDDFLQRIPQVIKPKNLIIGIGKAPVFALVIATVGCLQGFRTTGSADSVGRQTTVSVVQSIFLVIIADAAFSILFSWLHI
ncbi:MAG: ABC transporter permease [Gammaproteobacteria bacterium]